MYDFQDKDQDGKTQGGCLHKNGMNWKTKELMNWKTKELMGISIISEGSFLKNIPSRDNDVML